MREENVSASARVESRSQTVYGLEVAFVVFFFAFEAVFFCFEMFVLGFEAFVLLFHFAFVGHDRLILSVWCGFDLGGSD